MADADLGTKEFSLLYELLVYSYFVHIQFQPYYTQNGPKLFIILAFLSAVGLSRLNTFTLMHT